jgi:hypothetical protein
MQITPSDIVELVEVSAPGYKTVRYWLTFDRPTTLNAKLVKGNGLDEASEEATLVALGEVSAPNHAAVATTAATTTAPAVAMAKTEPKTEALPTKAEPVKAEPVKAEPPKAEVRTVAKTTPEVAKAEPKPQTVAAVTPAPAKTMPATPTNVPTPRKIGRGTDAEPAVASTTMPAEKPATPAKADPMPAPTKAEPAVAKPDLMPRTEPTPAVDVPKAEVAVAKPAIDKGTVTSVVGSHRPEVLKCFAEGKKKNPNMKGTVTLQLQVDSAGKVRAQVQSTLSSPLVAACVIKSANGWRFPARAGGDPQLVVYPFTIN